MSRPEGGSSDSEEERGTEAVAQQKTVSSWDNKCKQSTEQGGYSSEASSERGEIMHMYSTIFFFPSLFFRHFYFIR